MEGVYPIDPNNFPDAPKPELVLMGKFALALMATLFSVFLYGRIFGNKEDTEEQKEEKSIKKGPGLWATAYKVLYAKR